MIARRAYPCIMTEPTRTLRAGEYLLAVQGLAMIRSCMSQPSLLRERLDDIRNIVDRFDEFPNSLELPVTEHDVEEGYARWARSYDGPNPAIEGEEPIMWELLAGIPPGNALDAACGTGRHAARLAELGHTVIGVDATEAMLDIARAKLPGADLRRGRLEALPVDDASVDVITCALALEHVPDLTPVFREFARVMRPGGQLVISDMHPVWKMLGGVAGFPTDDGSPGVPFVAGFTHQLGDYVRAFLGSGFTMRACIEPTVTESTLRLYPSFRTYPEATRQAFSGLPIIVIWHVTR